MIRARLPASVDPARPAREFRPGQLAEARAWISANLHPPAVEQATGETTLRVWAGVWWQTYVEPVMAPNTARHRLYLLRQLEPLYGTPVAEIRPSHLQAVIGTLAQRVSPATVQMAAGVWRQMFEAAVDDDLIARNPARRLSLPKAPPRPARRHVTPSEARALLAAIVGHRFEAAYALLLGCGLRIGEVLGLAWKDVDLAGRRAYVSRQWTGSHWRELPKARNPHWVALPPAVVRALIRHRNSQPEGAVYVMQSPYPRKKTGAIQPWSAFVVTDDLHKLAAEIGLDDLTPHSARRGLVTALIDGGVSPAVVAGIAGHTDSATTLKSYAMASDEGRGKAAEVVESYLGGDDSGTPQASEG